MTKSNDFETRLRSIWRDASPSEEKIDRILAEDLATLANPEVSKISLQNSASTVLQIERVAEKNHSTFFEWLTMRHLFGLATLLATFAITASIFWNRSEKKISGQTTSAAILEKETSKYNAKQEQLLLQEHKIQPVPDTLIIPLEERERAGVLGVVRTRLGKPIGNAWVFIEKTSKPGKGFGTSKNTDQNGQFRVGVSLGEEYRFIVSHPQFVTTASKNFQITEKHRSDIEIILEQGEMISGYVASKEGKPLSGVKVLVGYTDEKVSRFFVRNTTTEVSAFFTSNMTMKESYSNDNGEFVLEGLPKTKLILQAFHEGSISKVTEIDLRTKKQVDDLVLLLAFEEEIINGTVESETGEPIEGALVKVFLLDSDKRKKIRRDLQPRQVVTDVEGKFTIDGLQKKNYGIIALSPNTKKIPTLGDFFDKSLFVQTNREEVHILLKKDAPISGGVLFLDETMP